MLILIAVTVSLVINSNLLGRAKDAGDSFEAAYANEEHYGEQAQFTIEGETYNSIAEWERSNCTHTWGAWSTNATTGKQERTCSVCGETEEKFELVIGAKIVGYNPTVGPNDETISTSYTVPVGSLNSTTGEVTSGSRI